MKLYVSAFCPKCELAIYVLTKDGREFEIVSDEKEAIDLGIKVAPCLVTSTGHRYGLKEILSICKGEGYFE